MATCYTLVGVPGSGKSTWASKQKNWARDILVISTDMFVEAYAKKVGKTNSEVFEEYMPHAIDDMIEAVVWARNGNCDFIWDQTSTTIKSRKRKFNMLPYYVHIAIFFKTPEPEELQRRLLNRPGKIIPAEVIESMIAGLEMPTTEEGFKEVWFAD